MKYNPDDQTVTIAKESYLKFVRSRAELIALQGAGVDNWEGYGQVDWDSVHAAVSKAEISCDDEEEYGWMRNEPRHTRGEGNP